MAAEDTKKIMATGAGFNKVYIYIYIYIAYIYIYIHTIMCMYIMSTTGCQLLGRSSHLVSVNVGLVHPLINKDLEKPGFSTTYNPWDNPPTRLCINLGVP